jgi:hypothetical protein
MSSKNNPEARNKQTELRKYNGKVVKPILFIKRGVGKYMAAAFENGDLVMDKATDLPIAYKNI